MSKQDYRIRYQCKGKKLKSKKYLTDISSYFIFALVTSTQRAFHCVTPLYSYLSPDNNSCCRFLGLFHYKAAAAHAECWGSLTQDLRERLQDSNLKNTVILLLPIWKEVKRDHVITNLLENFAAVWIKKTRKKQFSILSFQNSVCSSDSVFRFAFPYLLKSFFSGSALKLLLMWVRISIQENSPADHHPS